MSMVPHFSAPDKGRQQGHDRQLKQAALRDAINATMRMRVTELLHQALDREVEILLTTWLDPIMAVLLAPG